MSTILEIELMHFDAELPLVEIVVFSEPYSIGHLNLVSKIFHYFAVENIDSRFANICPIAQSSICHADINLMLFGIATAVII